MIFIFKYKKDSQTQKYRKPSFNIGYGNFKNSNKVAFYPTLKPKSNFFPKSATT